MLEAGVLEKIIYPVVDETNTLFTAENRLGKSPEAALFGQGAPLNSLGLVTFIVAVEERIENETGKAVRLVSEEAMSRKNSPFLTLGRLAAYIDELLKEPGV